MCWFLRSATEEEDNAEDNEDENQEQKESEEAPADAVAIWTDRQERPISCPEGDYCE